MCCLQHHGELCTAEAADPAPDKPISSPFCSSDASVQTSALESQLPCTQAKITQYASLFVHTHTESSYAIQIRDAVGIIPTFKEGKFFLKFFLNKYLHLI